MQYIDIPTKPEIKSLIARRADACVSLYVPSDAISQNTNLARIELKNLAKGAFEQLRAVDFDKRRLASMEEQVADLQDDDEFWRFQANSLAIFLTPDNIVTFRLPNRLSALAQVSDRFHIKPLLRSVSFPFVAFVLAIAQNSIRLIEVSRDAPANEIKLVDMPKDMSDAVQRALPRDTGRNQSDEGYTGLLRQHLRKIDKSLRPFLSGRDTPLILATVAQTAAIYRSVNHYPGLLDSAIAGNTEHMSAEEIGQKARSILADSNEATIREWIGRFAAQQAQDLASSDLAYVARAASAGAVATLLVDIDEIIPGTIEPGVGTVSLVRSESASSYDVVDEIAALTIQHDGDVIGVRKKDMPNGVAVAALLRYRI